jgi:hypothetical protein
MVRSKIMERILSEARFEEQVAAAIAAIEKPIDGDLRNGIEKLFERARDREWRDHIEAAAIECGAPPTTTGLKVAENVA